MEHHWPEVMHQPLAAPYRPDVSHEHRRMSAIADGLMCWGTEHAAKNFGIKALPKQFGDVLIKLSREAGIFPKAADKDFMAAAKALEKAR